MDRGYSVSLRILQSTGFLALLLSFIFIVPTVKADNGQTYQVGTDHLNVRNAPVGDAQVIGQLGYGNQVVIFKESNGWGQTYYDGKEAWVALQYLYMDMDHEQNVAPVSTPSTVTITANSVRIRSGPSTSYDMIGSTSEGGSFQLLSSEGDWYEIELANGKTGWVAGWLATSSDDIPIVESTNNIKPATVSTSDASIVKNTQPLTGYNIVLDPGHGGLDPGSIAIDGSYEKDHVLNTAFVISQTLQEAGATVIMTREDDHFISLDERVSISQAYDTHAFISLHYDAYPLYSVNGFSTHYYSMFGDDRNLAQSIQANVSQYVQLNNRGIMQSNLQVLRENSDLSALIELGFLTNPFDFSTIQMAEYQQGVAEGITNGLIDYFNR